jgi:protein-S-isoprenylcysteine O-methyltransferase Ste14
MLSETGIQIGQEFCPVGESKENVIMSQTPWGKGTHGEWYVFAQIALIVLVFFGPRTYLGWPIWTTPFTWLGSIGGGVILLTGILLLVGAIFWLGSNLTAAPYPKEQSTLVETGPSRIVRHPMLGQMVAQIKVGMHDR